MNNSEKKDPSAKVQVKITNENNGKHQHFEEHLQTPVSAVVKQMYESEKLGIRRSRLPGDRLRCTEGGADIFQYEHLTLLELAEKHCESLHWKFSGESGGA